MTKNKSKHSSASNLKPKKNRGETHNPATHKPYPQIAQSEWKGDRDKQEEKYSKIGLVLKIENCAFIIIFDI